MCNGRGARRAFARHAAGGKEPAVNRSAAVVVEVPVDVARSGRRLDRLRRRLATSGATTEEAVVLDLLDDDLEQARAAVEAISEYVSRVETTLCDGRATRPDLVALALAGDLPGQADYLHGALASLRRRLARVAARLPV
jgi:hypothetical protein